MTNYGPLEDVQATASVSPTWFGRCPNCGTLARLDEDQFKGDVSTDCPECPYHETHDYREK